MILDWLIYKYYLEWMRKWKMSYNLLKAMKIVLDPLLFWTKQWARIKAKEPKKKYK